MVLLAKLKGVVTVTPGGSAIFVDAEHSECASFAM